MKTFPLRRRVREPIKVKRWTPAGQTVPLTDSGAPLGTPRAAPASENETGRCLGIDALLDEGVERAAFARQRSPVARGIPEVTACADSSFLLWLVTGQLGTEETAREYRRLERPRLFSLPLHALDVGNAIRQRAFRERRARPSGEQAEIRRAKDAALARLSQYREREALLEVALDMDAAAERARALSNAHTDRLGARAVDPLRVACARTLQGEVFRTLDEQPLDLARAEGSRVSELRRR